MKMYLSYTNRFFFFFTNLKKPVSYTIDENKIHIPFFSNCFHVRSQPVSFDDKCIYPTPQELKKPLKLKRIFYFTREAGTLLFVIQFLMVG